MFGQITKISYPHQTISCCFFNKIFQKKETGTMKKDLLNS